ncbi:hypothetical protein BT96DRAFT_995068 [Gymnopus androsaceus JB14]|uniref:Uncharacterized protein n=1 Tax=Gymnopus androsaceus JB14 TaxID=1447944 RepID=A0A6A4HHS2_9AGAR|nr:hypothetical protein BT96DRAFT_995068 [Gymnopus androsaceus JB14]
MTPLRGTSAFGDRWGQTIYSVALSGDGRFNLEQATKLKQAIEEDDDQQQYLLLTVNDEGQQVADPTSTAHNPSLASSNNPLTLPPEGPQNPMPYLQPPSMWREWGESVSRTQEENPDVLGSPGLLKPASLETVQEEDSDSIYTNKGEDHTARLPRSPQPAEGTRRENPIPEQKQNASAPQVFWTIGELPQTQPEHTRLEPDVGRSSWPQHHSSRQALQAAGRIAGREPRRGEVETGLTKALLDPGVIGRGEQEEGGIRGNQYHTQWLPYSIPTQTAFQPPTQSPQNLAPPAIPPNTQGAPPLVQPQGQQTFHTCTNLPLSLLHHSFKLQIN